MRPQNREDLDDIERNASFFFSEEEPNSTKERNHSKMAILWSSIIFFLNIWILFFSIFWFSIGTHPNDVQLFIGIIIEWILCFEVISRIFLKICFIDSYRGLQLLHVTENDGPWFFSILLIASFPTLSLNILLNGMDHTETSTIVSYLLILKILRCFEIQRVLSKLEETLFYKKFKTLILIKCIMNFTYVLLITHVSTCSWLFINQISHKGITIPTGHPNNPFNQNLPYFQRMNLTDAPILQKYIDSSVWAVSTLTGCSFGDVTPRTVNEVLVSLPVFLIGTILLAKVFSDFASLMYLLDIEKEQSKQKLHKALKLCKLLDVPPAIKGKIHTFYSLGKEGLSQTQYLPAVRSLPKSLHIDIILWLNREMINKVNLFNFGSPSFVISVAKYLSPKVSMAGDYIMKAGEFAEDMYFIKYGEVEVLATDNRTRIAILREGAYFGEIGLLLTGKRTATIRALTFCVFEVINKDDFSRLMALYPEQKDFLMKISKQRIKTSTPEDLNIKQLEDFTIQRERSELVTPLIQHKKPLFRKNSDSIEETKSSKLVRNAEKIKCNLMALLKGWVSESDEMFQKTHQNFVILPSSKFYFFWTFVTSFAVLYYCSIVPYSIFFEAPTDGDDAPLWYALDIACIVIYFLDMIIHMNTAIKTRLSYITDRSYIQQKYINEHFAFDLVAFLPIDYIMLALQVPTIYISWVKVLRLIKLPRFISLIFKTHKNFSKKNNYFLLVILAIFYALLNHLAACIMHAICQREYMARNYYGSGSDLFQTVSKLNRVESPLISQPAYVKYSNFLYWAFSMSSSGAYGDIGGVAPFEKVFQVICMLLFRIYFAFVAAEAANIVISGYSSYAEKLEKDKVHEEWMKHAKLPKSIILRVRRFNNYIWDKFHGLDKNQILDELPDTTKQEILEYLLYGVLENVEIFPKEEIGLLAYISKRFRFLNITKDEYVFKAGETAEGIFFVMEGVVSILNAEETKKVVSLGKYELFGEVSVLSERLTTRTTSAKAITNVALAELCLEDLTDIWEKYPVVKENMTKVFNKRNSMRINNPICSPKQNEWILKEINLQNTPEKGTDQHVLHPMPLSLSKVEEFTSEQSSKSSVSLEFKSSPNKGNMLRYRISSMSPAPDPEIIESDTNQENQMISPLKIKKRSFKELEYSSILRPAGSDYSFTVELNKMLKDFEFQAPEIEMMNVHSRPECNSALDKNVIMGASDIVDEEDSKKAYQHSAVDGNPKNGCSLVKYLELVLTNLKENSKRIRIISMNVVLLFNLFFIPLNLAFESIKYQEAILGIEIVITLNFLINFMSNLYEDFNGSTKNRSRHHTTLDGHLLRVKSNYDMKERKYNKITLFTLMLDFIYIIPFGLIFELIDLQARRTKILLILLQLIRLSYINRITWIFHLEFFKRRYAVGNILAILCVFVVFNHIAACLFVVMTYSKQDFNDTWLAKIPAPQFNYPNNVRATLDVDDYTIYVHALYWSYVTTSHIGVGDVTGINSAEKFYSSFVIFVSTFLYAFLFGNLASMVDDLTPKFHKVFANNYKHVLEYVKMARLEGFIDKIHKYYSYLWMNNRGIDEDLLLNSLPISIKYDIIMLRYNYAFTNSRFFKDSLGSFDQKTFYSFCKKYKCAVYMENDYIIASGQQADNVYFILDGEAEIIGDKNTSLGPGDYFGGIAPGIIQLKDIRARKMTKMAVLDRKSFCQMMEAYPEWYNSLVKHEKEYEIMTKFAKRFKQRIIERRSILKPLKSSSHTYNDSPLKKSLEKNSLLKGLLVLHKSKTDFFQSSKSSPSNKNGSFSFLNIAFKKENSKVPNKEKANIFGQKNNFVKGKPSPSKEKFSKDDVISDWRANSNLLKLEKIQTTKSDKVETFKEQGHAPTLTPPIYRKNNKPMRQFSFPVNRISCESPAKRNSHPLDNCQESSPSKINKRRYSTLNSKTQIKSKEAKDLEVIGSNRMHNKNYPHIYRKRNHESLINTQISTRIEDELKWFIHPESKWKVLYELVHVVVIISSVFTVPLYVDICKFIIENSVKVGYGLEIGTFFITFETLCFIEQIIYLVLQARTPQYVYGRLKLDARITYTTLLEKGLIIELIALLPFNLALGIFSCISYQDFSGLLGIKEPIYVIGLLRMNRILLIYRLPSQFAIFRSRWLKTTPYFKIIQPICYLAFVWHFTSCLWGWFSSFEIDKQYELNWYKVLDLEKASLWQRYIFSLLFTMNIATTAGYPEMIIYNNYERSLFILYVYFGDAFFGLTFAWFAANSSTLPEKYDYVFNKIRQMDYVLQKGQIPMKIRNKLESYFAYIVDTRNQNKSCLETLSGLLPLSTLKDLAYNQAKCLHSVPIMQEFQDKKMVLDEIVKCLQPTIFLPGDYITTRNDSGTEMYIIAEGSVQMLSPNEKKALCLLQAGSHFGELSIYATTKRLTSFVAASFCLIYILDRQVLRAVLTKFPQTYFEYQIFAKRRLEFCAIEGRNRKDRMQQAYLTLRRAARFSQLQITQKNGVNELLKASEIPRFFTHQNDRKRDEEEKQNRQDEESFRISLKRNNFGEIESEENKDDEKSFISASSTIEEYVDDEEIEYKDIDTKKNTFRIKTKARERRYSRTNMGKEKSVSRSEGLTLRWGINMD